MKGLAIEAQEFSSTRGAFREDKKLSTKNLNGIKNLKFTTDLGKRRDDTESKALAHFLKSASLFKPIELALKDFNKVRVNLGKDFDLGNRQRDR